MLKKRNQKGFTLIEIIAVLVILGILAAVAIPKYFDLQSEARGKALSGAISSLQSTATQYFSQGLLNGSFSATNWAAPSGTQNVGDFTGTIAASGTGGQLVTVTVTNGPTGWSQVGAGYSPIKTFNMW